MSATDINFNGTYQDTLEPNDNFTENFDYIGDDLDFDFEDDYDDQPDFDFETEENSYELFPERRVFSNRGRPGRRPGPRRPRRRRRRRSSPRVSSFGSNRHNHNVSILKSEQHKLVSNFDKIAQNQLKLYDKTASLEKKMSGIQMMNLISAISGPNIESMNITDSTGSRDLKINSIQSDSMTALLPLLMSGGIGGSKGTNSMNSMLPLMMLMMGQNKDDASKGIDPILILLMTTGMFNSK